MKINKLKKLGLSNYEIKCYTTLIQYGNLNSRNIAKKSNVPPTSVYRNLERLQEKGFVSMIQKEPMVFRAIKPEIAIKTLIKRKMKNLKEFENESIEELNKLEKGKIIEKREEVLEIYKGKKQSMHITEELIKQSKKEFLIIGKGSKNSLLKIIHNLKFAIKRGVKIKFIITKYKTNNPMIPLLKKMGLKLRYYPIDGFAFLLKDRSQTQMIIKMPKKEDRIVLMIKNASLAKVHGDYFDSIWKKATPL
tara:strand:+ start:934 stop:1680 length:747 start_codon:yes stop_codon:yes gene_type:complete